MHTFMVIWIAVLAALIWALVRIRDLKRFRDIGLILVVAGGIGNIISVGFREIGCSDCLIFIVLQWILWFALAILHYIFKEKQLKK